MNDAQLAPLLKSLPEPLRGVILYSARSCTVASKVNSLVARARSERVAIVESDTLPHKDWLKDVFHIMDEGDPGAVHQGGEIVRKRRNLNNRIFHKHLQVPARDNDMYAANDWAWFMACDQAGIAVIPHERQASIFHDRRLLEGDMRFIQYAHNNALMAAHYRNAAPLKRRIRADGYYLVRGTICLPLLIVLYLYFRLKAVCHPVRERR